MATQKSKKAPAKKTSGKKPRTPAPTAATKQRPKAPTKKSVSRGAARASSKAAAKKPAKKSAGRGAPAKEAAKATRAKASAKKSAEVAPKGAKATRVKASAKKSAEVAPKSPKSPKSERVAAFDAHGYDGATFAPFVLHDCRSTQWADVRLTCDDWAAVHAVAGGESPDGYYLNGYGLEGLVRAAMLGAGLDPEAEGVHGNSEGDTCNLHFKDLEVAVRAATAAARMLASRAALLDAVAVARERGFED